MPFCQKHDFEPDPPTVDEPLFITGPGSEYQTQTSGRSAKEGFTFALKIVACFIVVAVCLTVSSCGTKRYIIPSPPEARAVGNVPPPGFRKESAHDVVHSTRDAKMTVVRPGTHP